MARNIEIKARAADLARTELRARALADQGPFDLAQDDTFFMCANGRLKLRQLAPDRGELIFYRRPDVPGPKLSEYTRVETTTPALLRALLTEALGVLGRVRKRRRLYLAGQTRIHLDEVEGLGSFAELEVVLGDDQSPADGEAVAERLLGQLGIDKADLVSGAYIDHLQQGDRANLGAL
ncbi:MAG TPA: class IV adenylate cyclase [Steroidobacteraceae bacterium]|nr:class IV adenylate cyclase [Steroidobacteraceae bacterium]